MKKYKSRIILSLIIISVLAFSFWWGGDAPSLRGTNFKEEIKNTELPKPTQTIEQTQKPDENINPVKEAPDKQEEVSIKEIEKEPEKREEAKKTPEPKKELYCTISIRCDTILDNMDWLLPEKKGLIPTDGIILSQKKVTFNEGETAFDVLKRGTRENNIHMEFVNTPMYKSTYIEGIANIYEFDCGELSGWMYKANGKFPNFGCSLYNLKDGDEIEWIYTCDLGADIGGSYYTQNR